MPQVEVAEWNLDMLDKLKQGWILSELHHDKSEREEKT
jgi:hypothetical protein